ncbi:hypothetical protein FRC04_004198 [Tulasnella sp. 424]|nr:hypothetical protein FRC04_004198 [Tulasnella sp. 424]KAG8964031.1 hypothetical protein FRC05_004315 [Tulasnella sp. 425]
MARKPSPPAPPPPEIVDQALALLVNAMEQGQPGDERGEDMESKMTRLDRLASCHQVAGEALQVAAQKRAALFRRQRNALIPINQLPSELLSAILIKSVNDYQPHRIKALQMLAQVAWQWWQTIKSDPHFWADITPPMEGAELQIRRTVILPLHLHWTDVVDRTNRDAFKNLVQRHARRWTGIELKRLGEDTGLQALCTSHFPNLKYLRVRPSFRTMRENWRFNLAQCQNLQEVHLPIMPYLPATPSSNSPIHLRTLHLDLRSMDSYSSHDVESLLRLIPQLVELNLENLFHDTRRPSAIDAAIIDLPNLRHLKFANVVTGGQQEWIPFLAQIRAPQLENLGLLYEFEGGRRFSSIDGRVIFTVLAMWPSASTNRPEDAPLQSVLRNAGPSASCEVLFWEQEIRVTAKGSGPGRALSISLDGRHPTKKELTEHVLTHFPSSLPLNLRIALWNGEVVEPEFWDEVLDATPSLRTFTLESRRLLLACDVMDRLSVKAPSSSSASPRAPHLEKLCFQFDDSDPFLWSEGDEGGAVKTMLDIRREIFIRGGVQDPPKLAVVGPNGLLFDEVEGRWLGL